MNRSAHYWKEALALDAHPEGGYYRRVYCSSGQIAQDNLPAAFKGPRPMGTAIYYLLEAGDCSHLHRIASDELWHHYDGEPLTVVAISPAGELTVHRLGKDAAAGQLPFCVVPAGHWFGAVPVAADGYSLVGCTVVPGFDFAEHEMAARADLLERYPQHRDWIERLTCNEA